MNTTSVDSYLEDGCGRCERYRTPECDVHRWAKELVALRELLLEIEPLVETMKWGSPCYTYEGKNVVMISARRDACMLSFFKGAALKDDDGVLVSPGPNSRYARYLQFTSLDEVLARREQTAQIIWQAVELERSGVKFVPPAPAEPMPAELEDRLEADAELQRAFEALTPGRRRSHILYVSAAKQSATREARVERCVPKIMAGLGYNERV